MKRAILMMIGLCLAMFLQAQVSKTATVTAGSLSTTLTVTELSTVTNLILTGTIDARDFKTMRDNMPLLAVLDLSGVSVVAYTGTEGTAGTSSIVYPVNTVPENAFENRSTYQGKNSLTSIVLPMSVTSIGKSAFQYCFGLTSMILPPSVTFIGDLAFFNCGGLTSINIPSSVTSIGFQSIGFCYNLTPVTIPSSVTSIGDFAFSGSAGSITVDVNNPNYSSLDGVLFNKVQTTLIQCLTSKNGSYSIPSSVTSVGVSAFIDCNSLTALFIPSSVTSIGESAFEQFSGLMTADINNPNYSSLDGVLFNKTKTNLIQCPTSKKGTYAIPSSVTSIGFRAFYRSDGLTSISIPPSVTSIGRNAFESCSGLTSITIPSSVTSIGSYAFSWCTGLASIYAYGSVPVNLSSSNNIFDNVNKTSCKLYVPSGSSLLYAAANQWKDFTNIVETGGFELLANKATVGAAQNSAATVNLTSSIAWTANSDQAWLTVSPASGTGNQTLTFTAAVNSSLASRTATVTVSATGVASQTILITQTGAPKTLAVTAGNLATALTGAELGTVYKLVLTGTIDARDFKTMRDLMPFLSEVDLSGVTIVAYNGPDGTSPWGNNNYPADGIPESAFGNNNGQGNKTLTSIILPPTTTSIGQQAFINCLGLTSFAIPSSVNTIDWYAFSSCSGLTTITIPASVAVIRDGAFSYCPATLTVDAANPNYSSIDGVLFNKVKTTLIQCPTSKTGSYTIPSSVASIGQGAFSGCSQLTSVNIPSSVQSIDYDAFGQCTGLISLSIPSSVTTIKSNAFGGCSGLSSISVNLSVPVDLSTYQDVFWNVNKTSCALNVPYGTKALYAAANQWSDFTNIVEMAEFKLSATTATMAATGGSATSNLTTGLAWTASSDQTWLTVTPASGTGNQTFTFTAGANPSLSNRMAIVSVSATGLPSQTIVITQAGSPKTLNVTAGGLAAALTANELSSISKLILTGTIDARDFKIMRDNMPLLSVVDLSGASIVAYTGTEGTHRYSTSYPANAIPGYAFCRQDANNYLFGKTSLTSIILPLSITSIEDGAFTICTGLTSITLPTLVGSIGHSAFYGCSGLTYMNIPSLVNDIGNQAFEGSSISVTVDAGNLNFLSSEGILFNKSQTILIYCPTSKTGSYSIPSTVTTIGNYAFAGCNKFTSITIPSSVTSIGYSSFESCSGLTSMIIPSSVTSIESGTFQFCTGLTSVTIPSSITSIRDNAYYYCSGLTSIYTNAVVPVNLGSASNVFYNVNKTSCTLNVPFGTKALYAAANQWMDFTNIVEMAEFKLSATSATIAAAGGTATSNLTTALAWSASSDQTWLTVTPASGTGNQTFTCTAGANTSLSDRMAIVSVSATGLPSQTIVITQAGSPKTLNVTAGGLATALTANELSSISKLILTGTIDARDFKTMRDNMPLLSVVDLSGVTIVAYNGLDGTSPWGNNNYPENGIPEASFFININNGQGNTALTSVVLPPSTTSIGQSAFNNCKGLTSFTIPSSVTSIYWSAFNSCTGLTTITIPLSVTSISGYAFSYCPAPITVDAANPNYSSMDGVLFNKVKTTLIQCPISKTGNYTIPSSVASIGQGAFSGCSQLTSVNIPSSVQLIDFGAFSQCTGLISLFIPSSVTTIKSDALSCGYGLASINVNRSVPLDLSSSQNVFGNINKSTCTLNVPYGTKALYAAANQWMDFTNIVEMAEFKLSATTATIAAAGGTATSNLTTALAWSASSDQTWLTVTPASGTGNQTFTCTAGANASLSDRMAIVSVSATGLPSQTIVITQAGSPKTLNVTAGGLATALTANELSSISKLILTGTIDARDFKTMRDNMPLLSVLDLAGVNIVAYNGNAGTSFWGNNDYLANTVPESAFVDANWQGKTSLTSIVLPASLVSIGENSFYGCYGLTSFTIPSSVNFIDWGAFNYCNGLTTINIPSSVTMIQGRAFGYCPALLTVDAANPNFSSIDGVLFDKSKSVLIQCPTSKTGTYTIPSSVASIGQGAFSGCSQLTTMNIPSSVQSIDYDAFNQCTGLTSMSIPSSVTTIKSNAFGGCSGLSSITVSRSVPVDLSTYQDVFRNVNKTSCTLNVPYGTKALYATANQWMDFTDIVEMAEFKLSATSATIAAAGGTASVNLTTALSWTASSDQTWLTMNTASGTGNQTFTLTATANASIATRLATVTVSAMGIPSQTIIVTQAGLPKTLGVTAGGLATALTAYELGTVAKLVLTGTIDARDFKTMRDYMPALAEIDLSGVTIAAYTGTEGTNGSGSVAYPANTVPDYAYYNSNTDLGKSSLTTIVLPSTITSIGRYAFNNCSGLTAVILPSMITTIGDFAFFNCSNLTSINIPSSVTSIGNQSISMCGKLTSVTIPSSVTSIGSFAFYESAASISVDANNPNYSSLDGVLFNKAQTSLIYSPTSKTGIYAIPSSVTAVLSEAFALCRGITSVAIPSSVTSIGSWAFENCSGLTSVTIPALVTSIGNGTFYGCSGLTTVTIPSTVTSIESQAFYNCSNLSKIYTLETSPVNLNSSTDVFYNINKATCTLYVPSGTKMLYAAANQWKDFANIEEMAEFKLSATSANIGATGGTASVDLTTGLTWTASSDQQWLTMNITSGTGNQTFTLTATANASVSTRSATVTITAAGIPSQTIIVTQAGSPKTLAVTAGGLASALTASELSTLTKLTLTGTIDARDFKTMRDYMPLLAGVDLSAVTVAAYTGTEGTTGTSSTVYPINTVPDYAFCNGSTWQGKTSLTSVLLPSSITSVGSNAFRYCNGLTSMILPSLVTSIGDFAFYNCQNLTSVTIPASVTSIGSQAISYCYNLTSVAIPASVTSIGSSAFSSSAGSIIVDINNPNYSSLDGILFNKAQTTLIQCLTSKTGSYNIPSTVTSIGTQAFVNCTGLTSVAIPSSVTSIGSSAFSYCTGLASVTIPSSVTTIGSNAFLGSSGLKTVDANNPNYSGLDGLLFDKAQTTLIHCPVSKTGSYAIPSSVTSIGSYAFGLCYGLTSIVIPASVKSIGSDAFYYCSGLTSVNIPSSVTSIGSWAFERCTGLTSVTIPSSVTSIGSDAFYYCSGLTSIYTNGDIPVNLSSVTNVFYNVNKATCTLYVPSGTKVLYTAANQWKDFTNIVEMAEFKLSATSATIATAGGTASVNLTTGLSWTAGSDQTWLTVNSASGTGNQTFTLTATANASVSTRIATVTITAAGIPSQTIIITQAGAPKTLAVTPGGLATALTATELNAITNLILTGTIDARDFKTMRDNMPLLAVVDLSGVTVAAYTGPEGTQGTSNTTYPANTVPNNAYYNSTTNAGKASLTNIVLPSSVTSIGNIAFNNCTGLTSVNIPSSVTSLGSQAFYNCSGLASVTIPASVTSIGSIAFAVSSGLITVDINNPNYSSLDGVLFNKSKTTLIQCPISKTGAYAIPSSVISTGSSAFSSCTGLTSITIPSSVTSIGSYTFENCTGLIAVTIPSSVTFIGSGAFTSCKGLTTITIPSSVTSIGSYAFQVCMGLNSIYVNSGIPVNLISVSGVFNSVNKSTCKLYVPFGSSALYTVANQWKDFTTIVEMAEFKLSATAATIAATGGAATVNLTTGLAWTASSDQTWLTINSASGTGNQTFTLTATANASVATRLAIVTITAADIPSQTIIVTQVGVPKTLAVTAGGLATALTATELSTITNLILTGTIDARDFKTMRDNMPMLASLDLNGVTVAAYTGTAGTAGSTSIVYPANVVPDYAFFNSSTGIGKTSLTSVVLPSSVTSIGISAFRECSGLTSVNIPSFVALIGDYAFYNCGGLTSVNIPLSVTSIGIYAFYYCSGLASVAIPSSVTSIGTQAFYRFNGSFTVDEANQNYSSKDGVLFNKLQTILIQCPTSKTGTYDIPASVVSIGSYAFGYCSSLTAVTIPSSVTSIGTWAFYRCTSLTSLTIPSSVTSLGTYAFYYCSSLTSVTIPSSVTSIGINTFSYCSGLTSVTIPATVLSIGSQAFYQCSSLSKIYALEPFPVNLINSASVFMNVNKSTCTLNVPYGTKALYAAAYQWMDFTKILELDFSLSATKLNFAAGGGTTNVTVTSVVGWAVNSDQSWLTVSPASGTGNNTLVLTATANPTSTIRTAMATVSTTGLFTQTILVTQAASPKTLNVTAGGLAAALTTEEKNSLTSLTLTGTMDARDFRILRDAMPLLATLDISGVTVAAYTGNEGTADANNYIYPANGIPDYAFCVPVTFSGKFMLTSIIMPPSITSIGQRAFSFCSSLPALNITSSVISIGAQAFCSSSAAVTVDANNPNYSGLDGVLFNKDKTRLFHCPTSKTGGYVIPSSVNLIEDRAFNYCRNLTSIAIPASVTAIGDYLLYNCYGLTSVNIPASVTSIGKYAFYNCYSLISVTIPSGVPAINEYTFYNCSSLTSIVIPSSVISVADYAFAFCSNLTSIDIPASVTSLGKYAFYNCIKLTSVAIPNGVTAINDWTFSYCSGLTSVIIPSSVTSIGSYAFYGCSGLTSIKTYRTSPVNLSPSPNVFYNVNKTTCTLYVPFGTSGLYRAANQWQDFVNIVEMPDFKLSATTANIAATAGSTATVELTSNITWTASSDQTWLTVSPTSGTGNQTLTFTAGANPAAATRTAAVTLSATGVTSLTVTVTQAAKIITHFTPVWTGNGFDQMNINIYSAKLDGVDLEAGDEVGIFDGTICVGVGKLTGAITQQSTLDIAVSKNDGTGNGYTDGNTISFKLYDASKTLEMSNVTALYSSDNPSWSTDGKFAIGMTSVAALTGVTKVYQDIALNLGWNIISAYVIPANPDLKAIFQTLIDGGSLKKVMDEAGKTIENFGAFGGWKNNIGNLNSVKGYKVNVTAASTLSLEGLPVTLPLNIPLALGWNIISYPCATAQDAKALVQPLIDSGQLKKVMDEAGKTIENFGAFGGWKNNIGNFLPGRGYKVNVTANCTLTITASANKSAILVPEVLASAHFAKVYKGNGTDHFNVHLVNLASSGLQAGDQIGIFDGKYCVGAATIGSDQMASGNISIPASCNDETTGKVNGFTVGHPVTLQLYRENQIYPLAPAKVGGSETFEQNGSLFLKVTAGDLPAAKINVGSDQISYYPNPFSDQLTIEIRLTEPKKLEVSVYDLNGKLVRSLFKGQSGTSETLFWDGTNGNGAKMGSGTYILKANEMVEKVALKK